MDGDPAIDLLRIRLADGRGAPGLRPEETGPGKLETYHQRAPGLEEFTAIDPEDCLPLPANGAHTDSPDCLFMAPAAF